MRKHSLILPICMLVFTLTLYSGHANAADVAKIGIVDFQRILDVSIAGKEAQTEIKAAGKKMEDDLKTKGAEIEELQKRLEREALVMSSDMREEKQREGRIKVNDFKVLQKKYMAEFKKLEQEIIRRIRIEVFDLIDRIGEEEGFLLILERQESGAIYFPNTIDVTDKLIQKYDQQTQKGAGKAGKS